MCVYRGGPPALVTPRARQKRRGLFLPMLLYHGCGFTSRYNARKLHRIQDFSESRSLVLFLTPTATARRPQSGGKPLTGAPPLGGLGSGKYHEEDTRGVTLIDNVLETTGRSSGCAAWCGTILPANGAAAEPSTMVGRRPASATWLCTILKPSSMAAATTCPTWPCCARSTTSTPIPTCSTNYSERGAGAKLPTLVHAYSEGSCLLFKPSTPELSLDRPIPSMPDCFPPCNPPEAASLPQPVPLVQAPVLHATKDPAQWLPSQLLGRPRQLCRYPGLR